MGPEKRLDQAVERWRVKYLPGVLSIKLSTLGMYGTSGWPDRMYLGRAAGKPYVLFIEWKAGDNEPTAKQAYCHGLLRALGFRVEVIKDAGIGKAVLGGTFK